MAAKVTKLWYKINSYNKNGISMIIQLTDLNKEKLFFNINNIVMFRRTSGHTEIHVVGDKIWAVRESTEFISDKIKDWSKRLPAL